MKKIVLACGLLILVACGSSEPLEPLDETDQFFSLDGDLAAGHVLLAFAGAEGAAETVTRSEEEAEVKARELLAQIQAAPDRFGSLARQFSDGVSAAQDGNLGAWTKGDFLPEFEEAVAALAIGEIRAEPLRTEYGFHIIRRNDVVAKHYSASCFFISFKGHPQNPPQVHRTKAEAEVLARSLVGKINADNFEEMADSHNDLGEGVQFLGVVGPADPLPAEARVLLAKLRYGQVGGPVAFPMGYAFLRREKVVRYHGRGILIAYKGAKESQGVLRSKEEARKKAETLLAQLVEDPTKFGELARAHSDSPTAGKDGEWQLFRGEMEPSFRSAYEPLEVGAFTAAPVETPYGYYLIQRLADTP